MTVDEFEELWGLQGNSGVAVRKTVLAGEENLVPWIAFAATLIAIVLCVGEEHYLFGENNNRADIRLPHGQEILVKELKSKGINNFIHVGSNVLDSLKEFQKRLNI